VTIYSSQMDMGQGIYHGIATLVQEELDADWTKVSVVGGFGNTALYGNVPFGGKIQMTGGSSGTASSWERYRRAGATARAMLIAAAAERWNFPIGEIKAHHGTVSHASGRSATYGALAASAASGPVPMDVALKEPSEWKYIGNETLPRYDSAPKSNGRQQYTIDLREPGMLTAVMIHPPLFGATLKSFDASKAKAMKGIVDVVSTPRGVAVVGTGMWEVMQAREVVTVEWEDDKAEKRSSREIIAEYRAAADRGGEAVAASVGDVDAAFAKAAKVIEARYEFPYLAHAPLEPINAAARMNADGTLEVWGGHQMPDVYQAVAAKVAGIAPDKVILRVMKTGGGFGRRASVDSDIIVEAVATAKAMGWKAPVKVQWTREDDMRAGRYRPAFVHKMAAALDEGGNLIALRDTLVGQSIAKDSFMEKGLVKNGVDTLSVEGMANQPCGST
jgi:isoquinoline 1-oxidoreductase beta subunit